MRPRRTVRLAAVATAALMAGLLPGTGSAAPGASAPTVAYTCRFASGEQDVAVRFAQDYPEAGRVGAAIQPGRLTATVTIPRAGLTAMLAGPAATVGGTAELTAHIRQGGSAADARWPGLTAPATPADGTDDLVLPFAGDVPGLSVTAPGDVVFTAGDLALTLHPAPAATSSTAPGAATATPTPTSTAAPAAPAADLTGACTPKDGTPAVLGTLPVRGAPTAPTARPTRGGRTPQPPAAPTASGRSDQPSGAAPADGSAQPPTSDPSAAALPPGGRSTERNGTIQLAGPVLPGPDAKDCTVDKMPTGDLDPAVMAQVAKGRPALPGLLILPVPVQASCAYITGLSNVGKLNAAAPVNPLTPGPQLAYVVLKQYVIDYTDEPTKAYVEIDNVAQLDLPPSTATFLTYGFMPTTATMRLVRRGLMTIVTTGAGDATQDPPQVIRTTMYGHMDLYLSDVKVNGTPLDVGRTCRASAPLDIRLTGLDTTGIDGPPAAPRAYNVATGGPLSQDDLFIPAFTGCGSHGENLDALFTSSISGHGNSLNFTQGLLCAPDSDPATCDPGIRFPTPPHR